MPLLLRAAQAPCSPLLLRRGMIRLPGGLGKLLNAQSQQRRTQRWQRVVQHPVGTIYRAISEVDAYAEFLPWCLSSRVHQRTRGADGEHALTTEIAVGFELLRSSFRSEVVLTPGRRVHAVSEPNEFIDHLSFTWEFAPIGDRACRLDLILELGLKSAEHMLLWELAQDKVISEYVRCFSKRCVQLEAARVAAGDGDAGGAAQGDADPSVDSSGGSSRNGSI
jgi:coenzyme Q-binding protein COQ10